MRMCHYCAAEACFLANTSGNWLCTDCARPVLNGRFQRVSFHGSSEEQDAVEVMRALGIGEFTTPYPCPYGDKKLRVGPVCLRSQSRGGCRLRRASFTFMRQCVTCGGPAVFLSRREGWFCTAHVTRGESQGQVFRTLNRYVHRTEEEQVEAETILKSLPRCHFCHDRAEYLARRRGIGWICAVHTNEHGVWSENGISRFLTKEARDAAEVALAISRMDER